MKRVIIAIRDFHSESSILFFFFFFFYVFNSLTRHAIDAVQSVGKTCSQNFGGHTIKTGTDVSFVGIPKHMTCYFKVISESDSTSEINDHIQPTVTDGEGKTENTNISRCFWGINVLLGFSKKNILTGKYFRFHRANEASRGRRRARERERNLRRISPSLRLLLSFSFIYLNSMNLIFAK